MAGAPLPQIAANEIDRLRRAVEELTLLNDLAMAIGSTNDLDEIIRLIVSRATVAIKAQQVVLTLVDSSAMVPERTMYREIGPDDSHHFHLTRNLLGCMCHERRALLINDVNADPRLKGIPIDPSVKKLLCVPLLVDSELIAVMSACNKSDGSDFLQEDMRILAIMASQSAQVLDRARLSRGEEANAQLREDLVVAKRIQTRLLPDEAPQISGYDLAGISVPAREVGGDYFDFIPVERNCWGIALGDVSGKGIGAALLMANLQAMLRAQVGLESQCREIMRCSNSQLYLATPLEKFATLFFGFLHSDSNIFNYSNGGHELPFLISAGGKTKRLRAGGLAIGIMPGFEYSEESVEMKPGDVLVIFSDGVTDVSSPDEEPFGEARLQVLLEKNTDKTAAGIIDAVKEVLTEFVGDQPPFDDLTMVVVKREKTSGKTQQEILK